MKVNLSSEELMRGRVVATPPGSGQGNWVGAPDVYHDSSSGKFYLTYRIRRPRGGDPELARGGESRIAVSSDGLSFRDIWSVRKGEYGTSSIEKSALQRDDSGRWRYFTSFVDPSDGRWCVARFDANSPEELDPADMQPLFSAADFGLEGVKDPWIHRDKDLYHLFLSVALPVEESDEESHATQDIYNTGECISATALATSPDLESWSWQGVVLAPDQGWDCYCRRLNSVVSVGDRYLGFYDGIPSHLENYEEKTGIVESADLRSWEVETRDGPAFVSPHGKNALRYMSACDTGDELLLYYEVAAEDCSHDLRVISLDKQEPIYRL